LPAVTQKSQEAGGFMSMGRTWKTPIDVRLLRGQNLDGAQPADLPVQQATRICHQFEGSEANRSDRSPEVLAGRTR
jgi:hypothetical protein